MFRRSAPLHGRRVLISLHPFSGAEQPWYVLHYSPSPGPPVYCPHPPLRADIFRWDNGELIPGTEGIIPGPGVEIRKTLKFADLARFDLTGAVLQFSNLTEHKLDGSILSNADLSHVTLTNGSLQATILTDVNLISANLGNARLDGANLTQADFTFADFSGASLTNRR